MFKNTIHSSSVRLSDEAVLQEGEKPCLSDDDDSGYDAGSDGSGNEECSIASLIQQNESAELDRRLSSCGWLSTNRLNRHLLFSIECGQMDCVKTLIERGANMNASVSFGSDSVSSFYMAAYYSCYRYSDDDSTQILGFLIQNQFKALDQHQVHQLIERAFGQFVVKSQVEFQDVKDTVNRMLAI